MSDERKPVDDKQNETEQKPDEPSEGAGNGPADQSDGDGKNPVDELREQMESFRRQLKSERNQWKEREAELTGKVREYERQQMSAEERQAAEAKEAAEKQDKLESDAALAKENLRRRLVSGMLKEAFPSLNGDLASDIVNMLPKSAMELGDDFDLSESARSEIQAFAKRWEDILSTKATPRADIGPGNKRPSGDQNKKEGNIFSKLGRG